MKRKKQSGRNIFIDVQKWNIWLVGNIMIFQIKIYKLTGGYIYGISVRNQDVKDFRAIAITSDDAQNYILTLECYVGIENRRFWMTKHSMIKKTDCEVVRNHIG